MVAYGSIVLFASFLMKGFNHNQYNHGISNVQLRQTFPDKDMDRNRDRDPIVTSKQSIRELIDEFKFVNSTSTANKNDSSPVLLYPTIMTNDNLFCRMVEPFLMEEERYDEIMSNVNKAVDKLPAGVKRYNDTTNGAADEETFTFKISIDELKDKILKKEKVRMKQVVPSSVRSDFILGDDDNDDDNDDDDVDGDGDSDELYMKPSFISNLIDRHELQKIDGKLVYRLKVSDDDFDHGIFETPAGSNSDDGKSSSINDRQDVWKSFYGDASMIGRYDAPYQQQMPTSRTRSWVLQIHKSECMHDFKSTMFIGGLCCLAVKALEVASSLILANMMKYRLLKHIVKRFPVVSIIFSIAVIAKKIRTVYISKKRFEGIGYSDSN